MYERGNFIGKFVWVFFSYCKRYLFLYSTISVLEFFKNFLKPKTIGSKDKNERFR